MPKSRASVSLSVASETKTRAFLVGVNEVHALGPEGWVLGRISSAPDHGEVLGVHPDPAFKEIFLVSSWLNVDRIDETFVPRLNSRDLEFIVFRA